SGARPPFRAGAPEREKFAPEESDPRLARLKKSFQCLRAFFKEPGEVGEHFHCFRAEMMFDTLDVPLLRRRIKTEQREKAREGFVAFLNVAGNLLSLLREHQSAVFLVIQVTQLAKFLHHAGDG